MLVHPTAILNDEPIRSDRLSRPLPAHLPGTWLDEGVQVGPHAIIQRDVIVRKGTMVGAKALIFCGAQIGERCLIGAGAEIGRGAMISNEVKILAKAFVSGGAIIGHGSVIGMGAILTDDDDPLNWQEKVRRPVRIGERVQIGSGAILLPGVEIGDDAIVGAGAVVRWPVPNGQRVLGIPARAA